MVIGIKRVLEAAGKTEFSEGRDRCGRDEEYTEKKEVRREWRIWRKGNSSGEEYTTKRKECSEMYDTEKREGKNTRMMT